MREVDRMKDQPYNLCEREMQMQIEWVIWEDNKKVGIVDLGSRYRYKIIAKQMEISSDIGAIPNNQIKNHIQVNRTKHLNTY